VFISNCSSISLGLPYGTQLTQERKILVDHCTAHTVADTSHCCAQAILKRNKHWKQSNNEYCDLSSP